MPSQQLVMANRESEIHERGDYDVLPAGNFEYIAVDQQYALTSPAATISAPPTSWAPSSSSTPNWEEMWRKLGSELNEQGHKLDELGREQIEQGHKLNELGRQQIKQGHKLNEQSHKLNEQSHKLNELDRKLSEQGHQLAAILASIERLKPSGQAFVQPPDSTSSEDGDD